MKTILHKLLCKIEMIGEEHEEIFDTAVRLKMRSAIIDGFVRAQGNTAIPIDVALGSEELNASVHKAISSYVKDANELASKRNIISFHERLDAYQDDDVTTEQGNDYDEFFGHLPSEDYDENGNVLPERKI